MKEALSLFGNLILTFIAFVVPLLTVFLSIFQKGLLTLKTQYENERSQTEQNIKMQLQKISRVEESGFQEKEIQDNLTQLKKVKKQAERKLSELNPKHQVLKIFIPLVIAFLLIDILLLILPQEVIGQNNIYILIYALFGLSIILFSYALWVVWQQINIIVEVKKLIDEEDSNKNMEIIQALISSLKDIEKGKDNFLKKVFIQVNDNIVSNNTPTIEMAAEVKGQLQVKIANFENRMAKNIEIGLIFPKDFIFEQDIKYKITRTDTLQYLRKEVSLIHGKTGWQIPDLWLTPLKKGSPIIKTFIKAENIEVKYESFKIKVS